MDIPELDMPAALVEVAQIGFECDWDEETGELRGCDFESYGEFEQPCETAMWFRLWSVHEEFDYTQFRFFGSTAAGDYVGFWLVRPDVDISEQPVVYISSDGDIGLITQNLDDLLWLFANGSGPAEAFEDPGRKTQPNEEIRPIAERYAPGKCRSTAEIVASAQKEFPNLMELVRQMYE
ncbi:hypothetical protein NUU61_003608 [Penicillium alfredii]|uniref:SMI1/KNR4 family protein n=1 Tax=Penicillium alfredii TaxID=1506179 RepID=A0A9W9KD31_9EURO|nr:uncharacterized protein NUU61_003608 [Penicillium alfredii]KAJ5101386.1 hypothetical protein NUU61_003608 [Penicillium alfredii]